MVNGDGRKRMNKDSKVTSVRVDRVKEMQDIIIQFTDGGCRLPLIKGESLPSVVAKLHGLAIHLENKHTKKPQQEQT